MENINEEIERMKSLMTEERLYGRLVEQSSNQCVDEDETLSKVSKHITKEYPTLSSITSEGKSGNRCFIKLQKKEGNGLYTIYIYRDWIIAVVETVDDTTVAFPIDNTNVDLQAYVRSVNYKIAGNDTVGYKIIFTKDVKLSEYVDSDGYRQKGNFDWPAKGSVKNFEGLLKSQKMI